MLTRLFNLARDLLIPNDATKFLNGLGAWSVPAGGGGGGGDSVVLLAKTVLTDAQIKALPTTPIELVAAPGSGKAILPIQVFLSWSFAVAYDANTHHLDAVSAQWTSYKYGGLWNSTDIGNQLNDFLTTTGSRQTLLAPDALWFSSADIFGVTSQFNMTDGLDNEHFFLRASTTGGADFTGGNSANTLTVNVLYAVLDL